MEEYARDAYSRTGHSLLDTIARVHPFIVSTLLEETRKVVDEIGEVSIPIDLCVIYCITNCVL